MDATHRNRRVAFLDRDGVINRPPPEGAWVFRWEEFAFADGALDALRRLREHGFTVVVVTNQSCVGRGLATLETIQSINARMVEAVSRAGGAIAGVYVCPHVDADGCACRKPKAGLIEQAAGDLALDPAGAFVVGDSERDIQAGAAVGCTTILVGRPGKTVVGDVQPDHTVGSLAQAADLMIRLVSERAP